MISKENNPVPAGRIVVKIGTSTLTGGGKKLSAARLVDLARQIAILQEQGRQVALVSSGAIAAGREALGFPTLPKHLPAKQMLAAVGQPKLMALYAQLFSIYNTRVAQVLLTRADLADRRRYLNARNTLEALLAQKVLPVINENDTVAIEEIRFGDNDTLSAQVASLIEADLLLLLTDQDGLYTADPRLDPSAQLIREVPAEPFPETLWRAAGESNSGLGTGGMVTKLQAADLARHAGTTIMIAQGSAPDVLLRLVAGEALGTRVLPAVNKLEARKRYILSGNRPAGEISVDRGAAGALARGGSLLPAGITRVSGSFERGDTVRIASEDGRALAVGLVSYPSADLSQLCGKQSAEIEGTLGYTFGDEVIHRNNMILV